MREESANERQRQLKKGTPFEPSKAPKKPKCCSESVNRSAWPSGWKHTLSPLFLTLLPVRGTCSVSCITYLLLSARCARRSCNFALAPTNKSLTKAITANRSRSTLTPALHVASPQARCGGLCGRASVPQQNSGLTDKVLGSKLPINCKY